MYTANQIADWVLSKVDRLKGDTISHLKLQKIVYYCQAWHLAIFNTSLFEEPIQAWASGPVTPSVYFRFADTLKYSAINFANYTINPPTIENESSDLLIEVFSIYNEHSGAYLEALTHSEDPWIIARGDTPLYQWSNAEITKESMTNFYSALHERQQTPQS